MASCRSIGLLAGVIVAIQSDARAEIRYRVQRIGDLPGGHFYSVTTDINSSGMVCGRSLATGDVSLAIIWSEQTGLVSLGDFPGSNVVSAAYAINDLGHATGVSDADADIGTEGFFWTPENGMIRIGTIPGGARYYSQPWDMNDLDQIVGDSVGANGDHEAFLWDPVNGMIGLGDLPGGQTISWANAMNNRTEVVGISGSGRAIQGEAFIWDAERGMQPFGDLPGGGWATSGLGINNLGYVTGTCTQGKAYIWQRDQGFVQMVSPLPGFTGAAGLDINDNMTMTVILGHPDSHQIRNAVWDPRRGLRVIDDLIDPCVQGQTNRLRFNRLNNRGQIAAIIDPPNREGAVLTPYIPGDLDENEQVDLFDLAALLSHFGLPGGASYQDGDLDCDADVDLQDLAILLGNFGETLP
ncbi:MAG: hypothetical protein HZB38_03720 [Planctomycetes bacterium]|nr:hypothetical protein [Planctomycetota bacterium]